MTINQALALARQHHRTGRLAEAERLYRQIIAQQPNNADALHYLGVIAHQMGRDDMAVQLIELAITLKPNWSQALSNLGAALRDKGQLNEAIAAFSRAIAMKPDYAVAHSNLGAALQDKGLLDEAVAACQQAVELRPAYAEGHSNLGVALMFTGRIDDAIASFRRAIAIKPDFARAHSNLLLCLHYQPDYDARAIYAEHRQWDKQHAAPLHAFIRSHSNSRDPDRQLRIGYVSSDFREHPVGRFLLPLVENHDRECFAVLAYAHVSLPDSMTERLRSFTDRWRNIVGLPDAHVADLIRQDKVDILVDLSMHTANNRLLVFARKPAPVQVTYLAYCSTTGLKTIDYRLSDGYLDSLGGDSSNYSEETIRLKTYWCYQPHIEPPAVSPLPAIDRGFVTFGSLNNFCKINEPVLAGWAQLLHAVPQSELVLHASEGGARLRTLDRLAREGIEPKRIRFKHKLPPLAYFDLYAQIDIALDTFPYGGGTTTCDALWMGVPVVSLAGGTAAGRSGLSILSNVGLPDLVARSRDDYTRIARELASDLPRLSNLRAALRKRMQNSPLMDAPSYARDVEAAYRRIWRGFAETRIGDSC